jgi:hypothetical protein
MGFRIEVRDEAGRVLATAELSDGVSAALPRYGDPDFPVLRYLDEYGDTVLNSLQVRDLVGELGRLRGDGDEDWHEGLDGLVELAQGALATPHLFLVFVGD